MQLIVGRLFHAVGFVVIHLREIVPAGFYYNVAGGAGAASAARMFEMKTEIHRDIEQRTGFSVVLIGQLARFKLKGLIRWQEGNFWHLHDYSGRTTENPVMTTVFGCLTD